ncbi:MAG: 5-formyltetrahydrofolate cyclo-ligase [Nevskiaceae bacterium]|jgi:5-formyltetrahydrofolate cyclo-ligase|nr:5-formyltetrahydrofolate cyclo-ligase [Nevskiaceae bacterium]
MTEPTAATDADAANRRALRRELRARRRAITGRARALASHRVARLIENSGLLKHDARLGLFLSSDEEIDTAPLLALAQARGCRLYLPRITSTRDARMRFIAFQTGDALREGPWGMIEPASGTPINPRALDVVFLPLVGFDDAGHRIGMGKGFYDRHFAHRREPSQLRRPLLVGMAYQVQRMSALPHAPHDVPLDAIVTEFSFLRFRRERR